jgi:hypothetical protein
LITSVEIVRILRFFLFQLLSFHLLFLARVADKVHKKLENDCENDETKPRVADERTIHSIEEGDIVVDSWLFACGVTVTAGTVLDVRVSVEHTVLWDSTRAVIGVIGCKGAESVGGVVRLQVERDD